MTLFVTSRKTSSATPRQRRGVAASAPDDGRSPRNDLILLNVDQARILLAEARDAGDAKRIADLARAAEIYAKRQHLSEEIIRHAGAIKVDAMTLLGEFLRLPESKNKGGGEKGVGRRGKQCGSPEEPHSIDLPPTLAESGISKKESVIAQALASLLVADPTLHESVRSGTLSIMAALNRVRRKKEDEAKAEMEADLEAEA